MNLQIWTPRSGTRIPVLATSRDRWYCLCRLKTGGEVTIRKSFLSAPTDAETLEHLARVGDATGSHAVRPQIGASV